MTVVACVWAGDKYGPEYVDRLRRAVNRRGLGHLPFVCFTDRPDEVPPGIHPLELSPLPRIWWHKLYLFAWRKHGLMERILYFDLDTVLVGDVSWMEEVAAPIVTSDGICRKVDPASPYAPGHVDSNAMSIAPGYGTGIWTAFASDPKRWMLGPDNRFGDQWFIERHSEVRPQKWQELRPGCLVSYKWDCRPQGQPPAGASIVSFHGRPNPAEVEDPWVRDCWVGGPT